MTAFARVQKGDLAVELHSVNRRHLEVRIKAPAFLRPHEAQVRRLIAEKVGRGQVSVSLSAAQAGVTLNRPLLASCKGLAEELQRELGLEKQFCFELAMRGQEGELFEPTGVEVDLEALVAEALHPFLAMKAKEGEAMAEDITPRLALMEQEMGAIEQLSGGATERYREKLLERLDLDDERVVKEVALIAEKLDVSEEISRFDHHLQEFRKRVLGEELVSGKTLEFLLQELGREINTVGSKCADAAIAQRVVSVKSELEKVREQVQNVE